MLICLIATKERVEALSKILEKVHVTITFDYEEHTKLMIGNLTRVLREQGLMNTGEEAYLNDRVSDHLPVVNGDAEELVKYIFEVTMAGIEVEPEKGVVETS